MEKKHGLRGSARLVREVVAARAFEADRSGRLAPEVLEAIVGAGFARHFVPARYGGVEGSFAEMFDAVVEVGTACPSSAWCAAIATTFARMAAYLPDDGRQEVWRKGPDTVVVGSLIPSGTAEAVPGGWRVHGAWANVSLVEYSDWALVLALAETADGPSKLFLAVPREAYEIRETWSSVGLRATGSHTLVLDDTLVPTALTFERAELDHERRAGVDTALCAAPLEAVSGLSFAGPVLGTARAALTEWTTLYQGRATGRRPTAMELARTSNELVYARSAGELRAAELLLERVACTSDAGDFSDQRVAECTRDCSLAAELSVAAVDRLVRSAGTTALAAESPLQRLWRDASAGASHIMLSPARAAAGLARIMLSAAPDN
ncbi:acyl-CoA dehydrogenase family protein [Streptomyces bauhiniae]|uniref:acyl-CoA dehydrogenase family protein n=1 Tax=Streptomyces bauhiniae TaxID=2340725 RepID=UPI0035D66A92